MTSVKVVRRGYCWASVRILIFILMVIGNESPLSGSKQRVGMKCIYKSLLRLLFEEVCVCVCVCASMCGDMGRK